MAKGVPPAMKCDDNGPASCPDQADYRFLPPASTKSTVFPLQIAESKFEVVSGFFPTLRVSFVDSPFPLTIIPTFLDQPTRSGRQEGNVRSKTQNMCRAQGLEPRSRRPGPRMDRYE